MKKNFLFFAFLSIFCNCYLAQNSNDLLSKNLKKDSIVKEFEQLYTLTNTIHPGQFMYCSKKDFDKTYNNLKNSIKTDLSEVEYFRICATLLSKIKDGHTAVDRGKITTALQNTPVFPFSIYKIGNDFFFNKSTPENNSLVGLKIKKINGQDIKTVVNQIQKFVHLEGQNTSGINFRFKNFPFYYYIFNPTDKFQVEYVDLKNQLNKINLLAVSFKDFTTATAEKINPLTTEINKDNIAVLRFYSFENGYNEEDRKLAESTLDEFFTKINSKKIKNLIIDLRDNSGGSAEIANYLFSYLAPKPYDYFEYVGAKYNSVNSWKKFAQYPENIQEIKLKETKLISGLHCYTATDSEDFWWFEKQKNKPNFYKGNISVLINGGCFSTTGHFLALLREYKIGKFFGEYSQGSNYSNSGGQSFVLPYSKSVFWIPTFQYKMKTPHFKPDPKGIKPDVEIELKPNDLRTKFDRQLDFVLKEIQKKANK